MWSYPQNIRIMVEKRHAAKHSETAMLGWKCDGVDIQVGRMIPFSLVGMGREEALKAAMFELILKES